MSSSTYRIATDPAMPQIGQLVDERYEVLRVLGEGGFAAVFACIDRRTGSEVAMKVLDPLMSRRPELAERFQREVDTVTRLRHHNTIKVSDRGQTEAGCLYLVMELLDGVALDEELERSGPMPPQRVARITLQVLKSLNEAHQQGIIHRDLKPANIFLVDLAGETDYVKVLDFGIAKSIADTSSPSLTQTGELMCSPHYVAPERVTGMGTWPASDLYSLGILMIELLEGRPPYEADSPMAVAVMHMRTDMPVPMRPETESSALGAVIRSAVAKDIGERFESADAMMRALAAVPALGVAPLMTGPTAQSQRRTQDAAAGGATASAAAPHTPNPPFQPPAGSVASQPAANAANPYAPPHTDATGEGVGGVSRGAVFAALIALLLLIGGAAFLLAQSLSGEESGDVSAEAADPALSPELVAQTMAGAAQGGREGTPDAAEGAAAQAGALVPTEGDEGAEGEDGAEGMADEDAEDGAAGDAPILLRSRPAGAIVLLGEVELGRTPLALDAEELRFPASLGLRLEGYVDLDVAVADSVSLREIAASELELALLPAEEPAEEPVAEPASADPAPSEPAPRAPEEEEPRSAQEPRSAEEPRSAQEPRSAEEPRPAARPTRPTVRPAARPSSSDEEDEADDERPRPGHFGARPGTERRQPGYFGN